MSFTVSSPGTLVRSADAFSFFSGTPEQEEPYGILRTTLDLGWLVELIVLEVDLHRPQLSVEVESLLNASKLD
jgi:hypothetical protein